MTTNAVIARLRRMLREFRTARTGNVAITFAIATIPVIGFIGAAIDYSHANSVKAAMQAALDSTALMLSKDAATLSSSDLQTKAGNYFKALFTRPEATNIIIGATYTASGGSTVAVTGSVDVPTTFIRVLNFGSSSTSLDKITVGGSSTSKWGSSRLRVALVLDNTGSMASDGKITALKTATKNLLTQLQNAASTNGDVYVSIIPFSRDVSVDETSNYSASWIDWTQWSAPPANSMSAASDGPGDPCPYINRNYACTTGPTNGSSTTSYIPSSGSYKGYICPSKDSNSGNYYNGCYNSTTYSCTGGSCTCTGHTSCSCSGSGGGKTCKTMSGNYEHASIANATSTWNGCITDRGTTSAPSSANYDQNVTAPVTGTSAVLLVPLSASRQRAIAMSP